MGSGIVTMAFLGFIFFLVKFIVSLVKYISWVQNSLRTTGKIDDITKTINVYSKKKAQHIKYVYDIEIIDDDINCANMSMTEFTAKDKSSRFDVGDCIDVFYRQSSHEVTSIAVLKNECFEYFLGICICVGVILADFYIVIQL